MGFTRNRGSKRLRRRRADGRFERSTLENTFGWTACKHCGQFFECIAYRDDANGFTERIAVTQCPHCLKEQTDRKAT